MDKPKQSQWTAVQAKEDNFYKLFGYITFHGIKARKATGAYCFEFETESLDQEDFEEYRDWIQSNGGEFKWGEPLFPSLTPD